MIWLFLFLIVLCFNMYCFRPFTRKAYLDCWKFADKKGALMIYGYNLFGLACLIVFILGDK
jgi:hypothetical protein